MGQVGAEFPLIVVLLEGQTAPGLPFLRQLHWIVTPDPASKKDVARIIDAASGAARHRRTMALHLPLSRPRGDGGEGQRLFLRPRAGKIAILDALAEKTGYRC